MKAEMTKVEKMGKFDKYEVEGACDCLMRAEEIKKNPELMAEVSKIIQKKKNAINSLADLHKAKKKMMDKKEDMMEEDEDEENA